MEFTATARSLGNFSTAATVILLVAYAVTLAGRAQITAIESLADIVPESQKKAPPGERTADTPSEVSELLSEGVRDLREKAEELLEELPLHEVPGRGVLPQRSVMRLRPNPHFVGRRGELKRIAENLKAGDATAIGEVTVTASSGLGGVGKTQLACEFVYRYGRYFHGVYRLSFADPGNVRAEVASCGLL